jgi:hypothetical protein
VTVPDRRGPWYYLRLPEKRDLPWHVFDVEVDGQQSWAFPSVTNITDVLPKGGLMFWHGRLVARACLQDPSISVEQAMAVPIQHRDTSADVGSRIHSFCEAVNNGFEPNIEELIPEDQPYAQAYRNFYHECSPELILNEQVVYNTVHGYAGRLDAVFSMGGRSVLIDVKTSAAKTVYDGMKAQLAAYRHAEYTYKDGHIALMPQVEAAKILFLGGDGAHSLVEVSEHAVGPLSWFDVFLRARDIWLITNADKLEPMKIPKERNHGKRGTEVRHEPLRRDGEVDGDGGDTEPSAPAATGRGLQQGARPSGGARARRAVPRRRGRAAGLRQSQPNSPARRASRTPRAK